MDLSRVFSSWVSQSSKEVLLIKEDRQLTPLFMWSQASCLATGLVGLGLQPGDAVATWMNSVPEVVVAYLAVQMAGGCFVPLPPSMDNDELVEVIGLSRSSFTLISLNLYDRYYQVEPELKSVRQLIVDTGEAAAETTLPANARALTPMLMVGRDVTLPDIEPSTRSLCYQPIGSSDLVEVVREENRWTQARKAAEKAYGKGEKVLNMLELVRPEALLAGAVWPLLAGASVFLSDFDSEKAVRLFESDQFDVAILDAVSLDSLGNDLSKAKVSRVLWNGPDFENNAEQVEKLTGVRPEPIREAVDTASFLV